MLTIHCSADNRQIELAATPWQFARLAASIADLAASGDPETFTEAAAVDPSPYERCLSGLRIIKAAGPLCASVAGAVLAISGNAEALALFASSLPVESELPPGYHVHYEAFGREWAVSPESAPLILCVAAESA